MKNLVQKNNQHGTEIIQPDEEGVGLG